MKNSGLFGRREQKFIGPVDERKKIIYTCCKTVTKLDEIVQDNPEIKKKIDAFAIGYSHYKPSITSVKSKIISKKGKRK